MKYLAILRDSFREALDSKVVYFTFGLSLLLILSLLSVRFHQVTVKDEADFVCDLMNWVFNIEASSKPGREPIECTVTQYAQTNDAAEPWNGNYQLTVSMKFPKEVAGTEQAKDKQAQVFTGLHAQLLSLGLEKLKAAPPTTSADGRKVDVVITSEGSRVKDALHWRYEPSLFFGAVPMSLFRGTLAGSVYWIENYLVNGVGAWVIVLIGVIVTAFFIPNMLQKGSLDLLLVKPITRVELLLFKYLGGLTFVFLNSVVAIGGVWLVLGLNTGIWSPGFLVTALVITFFFAILYSVSALFGVLTRSSVLCIFMTCLLWAFLFGVGWAHVQLNRNITGGLTPPGEVSGDTMADSNPTLKQVAAIVNVVHAVLPRTSDLGYVTTDLVGQDLLTEEERSAQSRNRPKVNLVETLGVSLAFIVVMLGLACWRFAATDY